MKTKRFLRWAFATILLALATFIGGSWIYAQRLTRARPATVALPSDFPYAAESLTLTTRDGLSLSGWLVPADDRKKAIVLLHGYTGNRKQMIGRARWATPSCSMTPARAANRAASASASAIASARICSPPSST